MCIKRSKALSVVAGVANADCVVTEGVMTVDGVRSVRSVDESAEVRRLVKETVCLSGVCAIKVTDEEDKVEIGVPIVLDILTIFVTTTVVIRVEKPAVAVKGQVVVMMYVGNVPGGYIYIY